MNIHDVIDGDGKAFAFEVDNLSVGRSQVCRVAASIPGATIVRRPRLFSSLREEVFCEFEIEGVTFVAWEPFGDNSRYWIGPEPAHWVSQITVVREAFLKG
jgi:hypothetical protein